MVVGVAQITFKLFGISSLKGKRGIVRSMKARLANHFNASVAETDRNDSLDWAVISLSMVGNDARTINAKLDHALNFADDLGLAVIADTRIEIIHL